MALVWNWYGEDPVKVSGNRIWLYHFIICYNCQVTEMSIQIYA